ncbi:MAG: hypothetical protein R2850_00095 [Bacteroidia bacterium]
MRESLSAGIIQFWEAGSKKRKEMGEAARNYIDQVLNTENTVDGVLNMYNSIYSK